MVSYTEYNYDAIYRMTERTDADGTATFAYDAVGNLTQAGDPNGTTAFAYDALLQKYITEPIGNMKAF